MEETIVVGSTSFFCQVTVTRVRCTRVGGPGVGKRWKRTPNAPTVGGGVGPTSGNGAKMRVPDAFKTGESKGTDGRERRDIVRGA